MRTARIPLLGLLVACLAWPAAASAHGGQTVTTWRAGPYRAAVQVRLIAFGARAVADYTIVLTQASGGAAVHDARMTIDAGRGPRPAHFVRGGYELLVPLPDAGAWRHRRLHVRIAGPLGAASFAYAPPQLAREWSFEPLVLLGALLAAACFAQGFVRLRRRGRTDHAPVSRALLFAAALAAGTLALVSPIDAIGERYLLSAHMLQHVLIADVAPALALLALRGPLGLFAIPRPVLRTLGRSRGVRRTLSFLLRPHVSVALWAAAFLAWHVPAAYEAALRSPIVHDLEHLSLMLAGLLVWSQIIDPGRRRELRPAGKLLVVFCMLGVGQLIADFLFFSFHPVYPTYAAQAERLAGLSPLADQHLAGLVMVVEQLLVLGPCVVVLVRAHVRGRGRPALARRAPAQGHA
jgi:cytochrome c oxidase assembly factor CtaG